MDDIPEDIILPPPDIRAVADKTAAYVAKNGPEFEARILSTDTGGQKFGFMREDNPYHGYYRFMVERTKEGKPPPQQNAAAVKQEPVAVKEETPKEETAKPKAPKLPPVRPLHAVTGSVVTFLM